jgi:hypothetical protein
LALSDYKYLPPPTSPPLSDFTDLSGPINDANSVKKLLESEFSLTRETLQDKIRKDTMTAIPLFPFLRELPDCLVIFLCITVLVSSLKVEVGKCGFHPFGTNLGFVHYVFDFLALAEHSLIDFPCLLPLVLVLVVLCP